MKNPLNTHAARANSYFFNSISCYIRTTLLAAMALAASGGVQESTTITPAQMPTHTHALIATTAPATHATPTAGAMLAQTQNAGLYTAGPADTTLTMLGSTGGGQPVSTRDPHLAITWCVALSGVLPPAN